MTLRLEQLTPGAVVLGIDRSGLVTIVTSRWVGDRGVQLTYRDAQGRVNEGLLFRDDEARLELASGGRPWSFDGDGAAFRLASEAHRLRLAWLFDPFVAISSSSIEPLPHQIGAVYEEMLPRLPMRFLLADDPGAGKTIMAGLLIKEMIVRGDLKRCLIISPGSLTEQWQDELLEKFGLPFDLLTRDMINAAGAQNPFDNHPHLIARMDQLSRNEDLQERLKAAREWDLVIVDEAHRMSASYTGGEVKFTKRYGLGRVVGGHCRNFLLMTATPHNGHEEAFQLFLALLDGDRFEGRFRDGIHQQDPSDLMRRMIKEELVRFDQTPLFPERRSYTAQYELSPQEAALYAAVTDYVRNQMDAAKRIEQGDGGRRVNVGFALMTLQRRLASSSRSIYRSLQRRRERLESRLAEARTLLRGRLAAAEDAGLTSLDPEDLDDLYDEIPQDELENLEEELIGNSTAATTIEELEGEIQILRGLEEQAKAVVLSGQDAKWDQLQRILDDPLMIDRNGNRRKLLIFSEFRDTLAYLVDKIRSRIGRAEAVVEIHGGIGREDRRKIVHAFMNDPEVLVLVANDAAGEGVNLQRSHLMVNYDLPWNPNRIEQRFGRIHRIGQTEVCHLWNLIAKDTREGDVYLKLLSKLEAEAEALKGKVFDVLGQLFDQTPLRKLLEDAVLYGDRPEVRARLEQAVEGAFDQEHMRQLLDRRALCQDSLDTTRVREIRERMILAEGSRLQPHFIRAFFLEAFRLLGGRMAQREAGRYEITHVPQAVRDRDRQIGTGAPVLARYERVCFEKEAAAGPPRAELLGLGHPLLDATIDLCLERNAAVLRAGSVLIDEQDPGEEPRLLLSVDLGVRDGRRNPYGEPVLVSRRLHYVETDESGAFRDAGPAPYLDYRPATDNELQLLEATLDQPWIRRDWDDTMVAWAASELVPAQLAEVREQRLPQIDKVAAEVHARLVREIRHWDHRAQELREKELAGKRTGLPARQAADRAQVLEERLQSRMAELELERDLHALVPRLLGGAVVVPAGLVRSLAGEEHRDPDDGADAEARKRVELLAMEQVMAAERARGRLPEDVSDTKGTGYDVLSRSPDDPEDLLFLEVKGRVQGALSVTLTANEVRRASNSAERFRLAVVLVEEDRASDPVYIRGDAYDFGQPGFDQSSSTFPLPSLLSRGTPPA